MTGDKIIMEDIREIFIKGAWSFVVSDKNVDWLNKFLEPVRDPCAPCADLHLIIEKMMKAGIKAFDIARLVKIMQFHLLSSLCYYLEDPAIYSEAENKSVVWGLFEIDKHLRPKEQLTGLHEMVLSFDPNCNEMRPVVE